MKKVIASVILFALVSSFLFGSQFGKDLIKVSAANVSVSAPSAGGRYSNIPVAFIQSAPIVGNIVTYTFTPVPSGSALSVQLDPSGNPYSTTLNPHALLSHPDVVAAPGLGIPDNLYNITVSWQRSSDNVVESTSINSVTVDTTTLPGIIDEPQTGGSYTTSLPISVYLPDPASPGSVSVVFHNNGTGANTTLNLIDTPPGSVFYTDPRNIAVVSPITAASSSSLAPGNYNMSLSYMDDLGNPASTVTETNFTIAAVPVAPPPVTPPAGSTPTPTPSVTPPTTDPNAPIVTTLNVNGVLVSAPVLNADGTPVTNVVVSQPSVSSMFSLMLMVLLCCLGLIVLIAVAGYLIYQNPKVKAWVSNLKAK